MGSKSTTTQRNDPYLPAQPLLNQGLADAQELYDAGGFNIAPYSGNLVAEYDPFRARADAATPDLVKNNLASFNKAGGILNRIADPTRVPASAFDQVNQHNVPSYYNRFGDMSGSALADQFNMQTLPAAQHQLKQNVLADLMPAINASFAGSGMTGSSLHQQNLSKGVSAGLANVENDMYQQAQNRALQAGITDAGTAQQARDRALRAAGLDSQNIQTDADRALQALSLDSQNFNLNQNRALQAAGMMPGLAQNRLGQLDYLRAAGQGRQQHNQAEIQADVLQDQQRKTAELNALQDYLALASQTGSMFGVQSATSRQSPGLLGILGGGLQAVPFLKALTAGGAAGGV